MSRILYKYRGIQNFRFFVDIFLKNRLFAAPFADLNDPMEGRYLYAGTEEIDKDVERRIRGEKERLRICSLSRKATIELMWAHYAEGARGVAIGVEIDRSKYRVEEIKYRGIQQFTRTSLTNEAAVEILSRKLEVWKYEEEERVFVRKGNFVKCLVREVILGRAMSTQDQGFVRSLLDRISPEVRIRRFDELESHG